MWKAVIEVKVMYCSYYFLNNEYLNTETNIPKFEVVNGTEMCIVVGLM